MSKNKKRQSYFDGGQMYNNIRTNTQSDTDSKDRARAVSENPLEFAGTFLTAYMTTRELEQKINVVLSDVFEDYYGCIISVNPNNAKGAVNVDLFFSPKSESTWEYDSRAFLSVKDKNTVPGENGIASLIRQNTLSAKRASSFELTDYGAQILWDFLPNYLTRGSFGKKIDWRYPATYAKADLVSEVVDQSPIGTPLIYYGVNSIDIIKLLGFIYGVKDTKDDSAVMYDVNIGRPISNVPNAVGANWLLIITRMTRKQYNATMPKLGQNPNIGRLPINVQK